MTHTPAAEPAKPKRGTVDHLLLSSESMDDALIRLAKAIMHLDNKIALLVADRTKMKLAYRKLHGAILTRNTQEKLKSE